MRYGAVLLAIVAIGMGSCGKKSMSADEYYVQADSLLKKGEFQQAVLLLEEANVLFAKDTAMVVRNYNVCADIWAQHLGNYEKAIEYLRKVIALNPSSDAAAAALFKIGFTYETLVLDLEKAKAAYEEFLSTYGSHELAKDVKVSLDHLGESDDELLERLLKEAEKKKVK